MDKTPKNPADAQRWEWAIASGCLTLLLAVIAFFLPTIEFLPRGGVVGWLLFLSGIAEFAFGAKRSSDAIRVAVFGSALMTMLAGLFFITNPLAGYFPVSNIVTVWLLLRGAWVLAMAARVNNKELGFWLGFDGATDIVFGLALLVGLSVATLVVTLFGPTPIIVAKFAFILAASFAITGISQIAIGLIQRRRLVSG
ncbi:MAG TPA: DUF308 domain-containing protein [Sphingomicrobium sp.]|nr:DUF308 domain-containing protein [Sphingomicrobium sp.]